MGRKPKYKNKSYEEREEALMEAVHQYRTIQLAHEKSNYHMSFMITRHEAAYKVDFILSFMSEGQPGSLEQLVREQRKQERDFYNQVSSTTNKNFMLEKKITHSIREAVDAKLDEMGLPVVNPENYA